jgi:hypothetical protein
MIRRSLAEHISASANYLWRGGHSQQLLAPARDEVEQQARRTLANYANLDKPTQYQRLSECSGLSLSRVKDAMSADGNQHEDNFLETIQCLQQIRKSL